MPRGPLEPRLGLVRPRLPGVVGARGLGLGSVAPAVLGLPAPAPVVPRAVLPGAAEAAQGQGPAAPRSRAAEAAAVPTAAPDPGRGADTAPVRGAQDVARHWAGGAAGSAPEAAGAATGLPPLLRAKTKEGIVVRKGHLPPPSPRLMSGRGW